MNGRDLRNLALGTLVGGAGVWAVAATSVPNTFGAGQVVSSSQVNQNFAALASAVDAVAARLGGGLSGSPGDGLGCFQGGLLGQVFLFAGNFAPEGAQPADGKLLQVAQNTALYSVLGTRYGGDGTTTFALPDLRDVAPRAANGASASYFVCVAGEFPNR